VTVGDWVTERSRDAPAELTREVLRALGPDAHGDATGTTRVCLAAARRELAALVAERRFGRQSALGLLVVDALTTFAYERVGEGHDLAAMRQASDRGIALMGQVVDA
jgi:hypothetical protein